MAGRLGPSAHSPLPLYRCFDRRLDFNGPGSRRKAALIITKLERHLDVEFLRSGRCVGSHLDWNRECDFVLEGLSLDLKVGIECHLGLRLLRVPISQEDAVLFKRNLCRARRWGLRQRVQVPARVDLGAQQDFGFVSGMKFPGLDTTYPGAWIERLTEAAWEGNRQEEEQESYSTTATLFSTR